MSRDRVDIEFITVVACDNHGGVCTAVAAESGDTIQIYGLKDDSGEDVYFESEAYHLGSLANDHPGITYEIKNHTISVELPKDKE